MENKSTNGKSSYFVKAPVLPSTTDESLPLPANCETLSVKNKENLVVDKTNIIIEDRVTEEQIYILNTEITALKSFIIEQLLVIKTVAKEQSTDSSVCDPYKFSDEIKYLREENNTKNFNIQPLLENKKNIQNTPHSRTLDINRNEPKSTNHFILPKKSFSNIKPPSSNQITTSTSFDLLSENPENSLDANNVISREGNNAGRYSNKSNKPNNTSISTEKNVNFRTTERNKRAKKTRSLEL